MLHTYRDGIGECFDRRLVNRRYFCVMRSLLAGSMGAQPFDTRWKQRLIVRT